jgi:hypothetical protein
MSAVRGRLPCRRRDVRDQARWPGDQVGTAADRNGPDTFCGQDDPLVDEGMFQGAAAAPDTCNYYRRQAGSRQDDRETVSTTSRPMWCRDISNRFPSLTSPLIRSHLFPSPIVPTHLFPSIDISSHRIPYLPSPLIRSHLFPSLDISSHRAPISAIFSHQIPSRPIPDRTIPSLPIH